MPNNIVEITMACRHALATNRSLYAKWEYLRQRRQSLNSFQMELAALESQYLKETKAAIDTLAKAAKRRPMLNDMHESLARLERDYIDQIEALEETAKASFLKGRRS